MRRSKKPLVVLSLDEQVRLTSYFNVLIAIDKRVKASRSKQKRSQGKSRTSTKKSAQHIREVRPSGELFYCPKIYSTNPRNLIGHTALTNTRHELVLCT